MNWFFEVMLLVIFVVPVIILFAYAAWDVLRRPDTSIWVRLLWLVAFAFFPIVGALVYLVIRPPGTTAQERAVKAGGAAYTTEALEKLADLHDRGKLTDREYEQAKAQHVGTDVGDMGPATVRDQRGGQLL